MWGLLVSLAVLAPNLLLLRFPPRDGYPDARVPRVLVILERSGQALCVTVPAITEPGPLRGGWSAAVAGGVLLYGGLWARYLRTGCRVRVLYAPFAGIPVPMAIAPVVVFLATAAWLANPWIAGSAVLLGIGHIPASLMRAHSLPVLPDRAD